MKSMGKGELKVYSAGAEATSVHPLAREVMREKGIDISDQKSKSVAEFTGQEFEYVITLCGENAKRACPVFWGKARHRLHWDFYDPAEAEGSEEERLRVFRTVRDQIRSKLEEFMKERDDRDE